MKTNTNYLLLLLPLLVFGVYQIMGFDGLYGMDSYEYYRYSLELKDFLLGGEKPDEFFWTQGYPLIIAFFEIFIPYPIAGQLVSLFSLYGIFYYSLQLIRLIYKRTEHSVLFLTISLLLAPYFVRNSVQFMSDLLAVFCFVAAVYFGFRFYKSHKNRHLTACCLMACYACFTRLGTGIVLIPLFIFVAYYTIRYFKISFLLAFIPAVIIGGIYVYLEVDSGQFGTHHFLDEWSFSNYFEITFQSDQKHKLASFTYRFPNLLFYGGLLFYPGFFFLNLILLIFGLKEVKKLKQKLPLIMVFSILLNILFLAGVTYQGDRYLFPVYPLFVVLLYPIFRNLYEGFGKERKWIFGFLIVIQLLFCFRTIYPFWQRNQLEKEIVNALEKHQGNMLYCFEMDLALQQRGLDFDYQNLWKQEYASFKKGSLVLFNEQKFTARFKGKPPMNNWNKLRRENSLKELYSFEADWKIYRVEE